MPYNKLISLQTFLITQTNANELCVIRQSGHIIATFWIDSEDLFIRYLDKQLKTESVKNDEWGYLPIVNDNNLGMEVRCHYIDI